MNKKTLKVSDKRLKELGVLMVHALSCECKCISCKGLIVLANRINKDNKTGLKPIEDLE